MTKWKSLRYSLLHNCSLTAVTMLAGLLISCGGGSTGSSLTTPSTVNPPVGDDPAVSPIADTNAPGNNAFPYTGVITLDDYDWFGITSYLGVSDITLSPLSKKRLFDGSNPRRHVSGTVVFRQPCGASVHRIVMADQTLNPTVITPCSNELPNPGASPTNFGFSALSPDASKVAVEALYFLDGSFQAAIAIYNVADQALLARWDGAASPMWLRDGRLLMASNEGFFVLDNNLDNPTKLPTGLTGSVNNPALHPTDDVIAFEFNQQIWLVNTDGSDAREAIFGGSRLRYPAWSPDGSALAYLAVSNSDHYHKAIYFTDLSNNISYTLELDPIQDPINVSNVVNGPLSWRSN